jgi:hypothetical protein
MRERDEDEEADIGSDLEQIVAILEKSEIDHSEDQDGDDDEIFTVLSINDTVQMIFDEDGNLVEVNPVLN